MLFSIGWLSTIFEQSQSKEKNRISIAEVSTDSRKKTQNALFIPLVGDRFDGHEYVKQAIDNGAVAIVWRQDKSVPNYIPKDFPVFFVNDTLKALQELARSYRKEVNPIVIGVTGSNGKTTTKDILSSVVKTTYITHCTQGNFNNHIGLPLTILGMTRETEVLILEMGMSAFGEIDQLTKIAEPDYAIITNIGESHIEHLGSRTGIATAKLEIRNGLNKNGFLIIDGDEQLLESLHDDENVITCGYHSNNDVIIGHTEIRDDKTIFTIGDGHQYEVPLLGRHNAHNATYTVILGKKLEIPTKEIKDGLRSFELSSMRFELSKGRDGVSIINDAYNASPTSMMAAIDVVKQMKGFNEKVLVLGDILELGDRSKEMHISVANVIESPITVVFTYGEKANFISMAVKQHKPNIVCQHFDSKENLLNALQIYLKKDSLLLFKASRSMKFESFIKDI